VWCSLRPNPRRGRWLDKKDEARCGLEFAARPTVGLHRFLIIHESTVSIIHGGIIPTASRRTRFTSEVSGSGGLAPTDRGRWVART